MKIVKYIITLTLIAFLWSCKKENNMIYKIQKFEWLVEVCADSLCPMEVYHGNFIDSSNETQWIPSGDYLNSQWGIGGASYVVGDERRKIPESMQITWFSYAENKFYQGNFELPQKKIYDIFNQDYGQSKTPDGVEHKNEFNTFLVSMAPQGLVTLWVTGEGQIEIGTYEAKEIVMDWKDFHSQGTATQRETVLMWQKDMLPITQKEIADGTINNAYFKDRLERYHYSVSTNKTDEYTLYNYGISFLNEEVINNNIGHLAFLRDTENPKGIATDGNIYVKDKYGNKFEVRFDANLLEGQEMYVKLPPEQNRAKNIRYMKLWDDFFKNNKDVQFQIKFNDKFEKSDIRDRKICGKIVLKSPTAELELPNSRVELFDSEEW
jgi:hypothetical protein